MSLTNADEFLERYRDDYLGFTKLLEIVPKSGGRRPFELNDIQLAYNAARTPRDVVLKGRQVGLTTEALARNVWKFLTVPGARVVSVCQSLTDHGPLKLLSDRYQVMFRALAAAGLELSFSTETTSEWVLRERDARLWIEEAGASLAAAQKKGRSYTITRLHATEVATWEYAGETLNAMLECVPGPEHGTEIEFESTPNGAGGEERADAKSANGAVTFYWQCRDAAEGRSGYRMHFFPWLMEPGYQVPLEPGETVEPRTERERQVVAAGARPEQLKWYRQKVVQKGQAQTDQEYPTDPETCFLVSGRQFFDPDRTTELLGRCREPEEVLEVRGDGAHGQLRIWHSPEPGARYVIPADTSEGGDGDRAGGMVYERGTGRHMATLHGQFKPWELARALAGVGARYNGAELAVERNNHGHACLRALHAEQHYSPIWRDRDGKPGWNSTEVSRTAALDGLEEAHRNGQWSTLDRAVLSEVRTFVVNKDGRAEAAPGAYDDLVIMAAIGWDVIKKPIVTEYESIRIRSART